VDLAVSLDAALDVVEQAERLVEALDCGVDPRRAAARYCALRHRLTDTPLGRERERILGGAHVREPGPVVGLMGK
jgi:hypothetical protein